MKSCGAIAAGRSRCAAFVLLPLLLHFTGNGYGVAEPSGKMACRQHPQLVAPCFQIRGRLSVYNGAPALRIWPIGSKRLLGVSEGRFLLPNYENIPPDIVAQLVTADSAMFADFRV